MDIWKVKVYNTNLYLQIRENLRDKNYNQILITIIRFSMHQFYNSRLFGLSGDINKMVNVGCLLFIEDSII